MSVDQRLAALLAATDKALGELDAMSTALIMLGRPEVAAGVQRDIAGPLRRAAEQAR